MRQLRTREPCPSRTGAFLEGFGPALYLVYVRGQADFAIRPGKRRQLPISRITGHGDFPHSICPVSAFIGSHSHESNGVFFSLLYERTTPRHLQLV